MADWQTPKTDWQASGIPGPGDFNRIEGNILYLRDSAYHGKKIFTSNGIFIVPPTVTKLWVTGCGGGGGGYWGELDEGTGGEVDWVTYSHPGSSGASAYMEEINVSPGAAITVTVGAGGSGNTQFPSYPNDAQDGRPSVFGSLNLPGGKAATVQGPGTSVGPGLGIRDYGAGGSGGEDGRPGIIIVEW